ncbi:hypothetical protein EGI26_20050 [Lacihabitans sp. CCS-44]|uniref:hypothetical protein n=1 Tax=Lacihabitans sp. CCS-44 TaxID=2487331 RepID=UPI0020CE2A4C|nr:hypothetical protein [Lacihabitans sp. CCS-44]MCP9757461.1 hypothetical protein [Lacihabitans sp. CCS-44]
MQKFRFLCSAIPFAIIFLGCVNEKYISSDFRKSNNNLNIGIIRPASKVDFIEEKNEFQVDDNLSEKAAEIVFHSITEMAGYQKSKEEILVDFTTLDAIYKELFNLENLLVQAPSRKDRNRLIKSYNLSETILNVIEENKVDQLIIAYQLGFTRTKPNYRTQIAKGFGVGILTLGVYTPLPIKSSSKIFAWTIDTKTKKIIFHNKNLLYIEPLNSKEISNQICDVFEGFYTYKSQNGSCFHY